MENKYSQFKKTVWDFWRQNRRDFEWRKTTDPYKILVSEMMLQQTQTSRVREKYALFLNTFPTIFDLASTKLSDVLKVWEGLGYNRRALYLKQTAKIIHETHKGVFPTRKDELIKLPGIGPNTASAILAFAFNIPTIFIETNIRRVFIHEFFRNTMVVSDKQLLPLIEASLDRENPREWYYALMDYGAYIGKNVVNPNRKSLSYKKQSKFEGSLRETRGKILKLLVEKSYQSETMAQIFKDSKHYQIAIKQLQNEGFIEKKGSKLLLKA